MISGIIYCYGSCLSVDDLSNAQSILTRCGNRPAESQTSIPWQTMANLKHISKQDNRTTTFPLHSLPDQPSPSDDSLLEQPPESRPSPALLPSLHPTRLRHDHRLHLLLPCLALQQPLLRLLPPAMHPSGTELYHSAMGVQARHCSCKFRPYFPCARASAHETDSSQCTLAFLESYVFTAAFLHKRQMPSYRSILCSITPVAAVFGFACDAVWKHPTTTTWCWFFTNRARSLTASVADQQCVTFVDGYVALSIAT